jgi:hypothetical protein
LCGLFLLFQFPQKHDRNRTFSGQPNKRMFDIPLTLYPITVKKHTLVSLAGVRIWSV